jgi:hypothetical protein
MTPQMYFLLIALLILSAAATFIIVKRIEHQCNHEWETVDVIPVYSNGDPTPVGIMYVLKCKKCGEISQREIKHEELHL